MKAWDQLFIKHILPYCLKYKINPHLVQFAADKEYAPNLPNRERYFAAYRDFRKFFAKYGYPVGAWNRAEGIYNCALEGLHGEMRICGHTIKYSMLMCINYYKWIVLPENAHYLLTNHQGQFIPLSVSNIIHHFRHCCDCHFHWDPNHPGALSVKDS